MTMFRRFACSLVFVLVSSPGMAALQRDLVFDQATPLVRNEALLERMFSPLLAGVLRGQLGFTGVVVSDDLEMGAIRKQFTLKQTVLRAVAAGIDVLLFSNTADYDPKLGDKVREILVEEAATNPDFAAHIQQSYDRIVALKQRIGD